MRNDYNRSLSHCCSYLIHTAYLVPDVSLQDLLTGYKKAIGRLRDAISTVLMKLLIQQGSAAQHKKQHQGDCGESKSRMLCIVFHFFINLFKSLTTTSAATA